MIRPAPYKPPTAAEREAAWYEAATRQAVVYMREQAAEKARATLAAEAKAADVRLISKLLDRAHQGEPIPKREVIAARSALKRLTAAPKRKR